MKRSEHGYFGRREFIQTMVAAGLISASGRPAAAGQPTFGVGGRTIVDFDTTEVRAVQIRVGLAVDNRRDIVVVGLADRFMAAFRLDRNGALDPSFGGSGQLLLPTGTVSRGQAAVIQRDGMIILGGSAGGISGSGAAEDFVLWRLSTDGTPDETFGSGGLVTTDFGGNDGIIDAQILSDGRLIAVGFGSPGFAVAAYLAEGALDPDFAANGKFVLIPPGGGGATAIAVQSTEKILVAGASEGPALNEVISVLIRLNGDGTPDPVFAGGGIAFFQLMPAGGRTVAQAMTVQSDDKILFAGYAWQSVSSPYRVLLARLSSDGIVDPTFGAGGVTLTSLTSDNVEQVATDVTVDSQGLIYVAGIVGPDWFLLRFTPTGVLDRNWGYNGRAASVAIPGSEVLYPPRIRILPNRQILMAGGNGGNMMVVRFASNGRALE
jgi:uncharacterized delta-60 repeat protein